MLKIVLLSANDGGAFMGLTSLLICPENSGYITDGYAEEF